MRTGSPWQPRPLRGAGHGGLLDRLQAEGGNLAAAVRWYLRNDPAPLPHLFRVLWLFWFLREHLREMRDLAERFGYPWLGAWSGC